MDTTAEQPATSPALAAFLAQHQQAIAATWASQVHQQGTASPYSALSLAELQESAQRGIVALSHALRTGSFANLELYLDRLGREHRRRGVQISAILEGLLCSKAAVVRVLGEHPDTDLTAALPCLDGWLRRAVGRVAQRCADTSTHRLDVQHTESPDVVAERQRLAHDLHDSVAQALYSLTLYSAAATRALHDGDATTTRAHLEDVQTIAFDALREMRLLIFNLRPPVLEQEGLAGALQRRLDSVESRAGLRALLHVEGSEQLAPAVQEALYYIAQEALTNVLRHASARQVTVAFAFEPTRTRLEIADDGTGFNPASLATTGGLGIRGMRERVEGLSGALCIQSAPGEGTTLHVEVPQ